VRTVLHIIFLVAILIGELSFAYNHTKNLKLLVDCLCLATTRTLVIIKMVTLVWKRRELMELLDAIDGSIEKGE
jgi:hypothetical protein